MKLAKRISKGIALCAVLTVISVWGGVLTSCSNGSEDSGTPEVDLDVQEGWTAITIGDIEKYAGKEGTAEYTVTKNNNGSITISHDAAMAKYASCSFNPNFGDANTLYTKITNNSDVKATVQVQVNKAGTEDNDYQPTPTVVAVYVDGKQQSNAGAYSVECELEPGASVVIANKFDPSKNPDTIAISLNSQEGVFGKVEKGKITVSGISVKKVADESELVTPSDDDDDDKKADDDDKKADDDDKKADDDDKKADDDDKKADDDDKKTDDDDKKTDDDDEKTDDDKEEIKPAEPTVIYKLDFSGAEAPKSDYISNVDNAKFVPNEGAQITGAWAEFAFCPNEKPNLKDATHVKVNFKCSDDAAFAAADNNNMFTVGVYKYSETEKKDTNITWTCFLKGDEDDFPKDFTVIEKKVNWGQKSDSNGKPIDLAKFDDIGGLKIWTQDFTGTLTVQSIEFIKK